MNLKFVDYTFKTAELMKSGLYYLGIFIGLHTLTFTIYLVNKYYKDNNKKDKEVSNIIEDSKVEVQSNKLIEGEYVQMEKINDILKTSYKSFLIKKKEELTNLILQIDNVYNNIGEIRERLEKLHDK